MTAPAGSLNLTVKYFRDMLAACTAFRAWTGDPDADSALERIHYEGLPAPADMVRHTKRELENHRPFALVYIADSAGFARSVISTDGFDEQGTIILHLEQTAPENLGDDPSSDANVQWANTIGQIIDGLCDLRVDMAAGHVFLNRIRLMSRGWASKDQAIAQGLFQRAILAIDF
jgi:hypothetical protein